MQARTKDQPLLLPLSVLGRVVPSQVSGGEPHANSDQGIP